MPTIKFCTQCGGTVERRIPAGDNLPRSICAECGFIHYENPKLVVGSVPIWEGQILLCKRAIEPRYGFWTPPAGFMELGESLPEAAARETWEEALARVELGRLFSVVDVVHGGQVHVFFEARLLAPEFGAGVETLETRLFAPDRIPWEDIAFPSGRIALQNWLEDQATGARAVRFSVAPHLKRELGS